MLFKAMKGKFAQGLHSVAYCLDKERHKGAEPRVLKGDPNLTQLLIQSNPYKEKAFFGVLSFEEKANDPRLNDAKKKEIMERFEKALFGNYMQEHLNVLWIEHTDKKGRLELNIIVPSINVTTQKQFTPNVNKRDFRRTDTFCELINIENNFSSPFDPAKRNSVKHSNKKGYFDYTKTGIENYKRLNELDKFLKDLVSRNPELDFEPPFEINNRDDLIRFLKDYTNVKVGAVDDESIEVKLPKLKRYRKLERSIYGANFTSSHSILKEFEEQSRKAESYSASRNERTIRTLDERLQKSIKFYDEYNAKKYGASISAVAQREQRARQNKNADKPSLSRDRETKQANRLDGVSTRENQSDTKTDISSNNSNNNPNSRHDSNNIASKPSLQNTSRIEPSMVSSAVNYSANTHNSVDSKPLRTKGKSVDEQYYKKQKERKIKDDEYRKYLNERVAKLRERIDSLREFERDMQLRNINGIKARIAKARSFINTIPTIVDELSKYREFRRRYELIDKMGKELDANELKGLQPTINELKERIERVRKGFDAITANRRERAEKVRNALEQFSKIAETKRDIAKKTNRLRTIFSASWRVGKLFESVKGAVVEILNRRNKNLETEQEPVSRLKL